MLANIPTWRYPRSDLNHWIPAVDRFDEVLAEIISSYNVGTIQINPFTPKTKNLILEILRVQRLLFENSTSRKLFASYDVSGPSLQVLRIASERPPSHNRSRSARSYSCTPLSPLSAIWRRSSFRPVHSKLDTSTAIVTRASMGVYILDPLPARLGRSPAK